MNIKLCTLLTFLALGGPLGAAQPPAAGTTKLIQQLSADAPAEVEVLDAFE